MSTVDEVLATIDDKLAQGDVGEAIGLLRAHVEQIPLDRVAGMLARAGEAAGFADLVEASRAVVARPDDPTALFRLGYACIERGISAIAVPILVTALAQAPGTLPIIGELVTAYEDTYRYEDAVAVLEANEAVLRDWPERYLLAFNALMSGDVDKARRWASRLSTPDGKWAAARDRIVAMLDRADRIERVEAPPVRAWHYVLNASVLATISPYGFDEGMNGRYAFLQDTAANCLATLTRLRAVLPGASSVCLLPDRSSQILGLAAARLLELPARPWSSDVDSTVPDGAIIVAYDLSAVDRDILAALRNRAPGSVLVEHASCWTNPPPIAADFVGLLHQHVVPPWGAQLVASPEGQVRRSGPDTRPAEELADGIAAAASALSLDPETRPDDSVEHLVAFVDALAGAWPATGRRDRMWSPGPVRSSYFF
ncbi:MAG: hypothetical protein IRY85_20020 [Micromonosporaceae bacterium]|nr:hypothetical protein [Micromonosporaceae bacterium]